MNTFAPVVTVESKWAHPTAVQSENKEPKFPDYSHWNSVWNILRFIDENMVKRLESWILLIKKESPYSNTLDFMSLAELPPIFLSLKHNGETLDISTNSSVSQLHTFLANNSLTDSHQISSESFFWEKIK